MNVPNILQSLKISVESGEITLEQAATELAKSGWMNFIDIEKTERLLGLA